MYDRILIPTDGSPVAEAAVNAALKLAARFDAALHALYVRETIQNVDETVGADKSPTAAVRSKATDTDVEVTTAVRESTQPVHRELLDYADDTDIDCIVMGTHGRTGLHRYVLGSVTERTLRESTIPVMTVGEETVLNPAFESILVPTDGSTVAVAAVNHGIELSLATDSALHVVHVVETDIGWSDVSAGEILSALELQGEQGLETVVRRASKAGVSTVSASVLSGTPYQAIVDYAEDRDVDCLVIGSHGRTGLNRYLLGSVTERVVRLTDVPVFVVKS